MVRRTLGDVKAPLARIAGAVGMQVSDARVIDLLNVAIEELMNEGDFPSLIDRYLFKVYGGTITLPTQYERILYTKVNDTPLPMQSPWFEFVGYGPQLLSQDTSDSNQFGLLNSLEGVLDRDDVLLYRDIPDPADGVLYTLRLETTVDERDGIIMPDDVIIQGLDENEANIRSGSGNIYYDGIAFEWVNGTSNLQSATSTQVFSAVTSAIKPTTKMPINIFIDPVGGGDSIQVGQWGPYDEHPSYRRYKIRGLSEATQYQVRTRVRKKYAPVVNDNDFLLIPNLPALRAMMLAVYYFEIGQIDEYMANKATAINILNQEAKAYIGQQRRKPLITFAEGTGTRLDGFYIQ